MKNSPLTLRNLVAGDIENMDRQANKDHWTSWAREHGEGLKATTRTGTAKTIEVAALRSAFIQYLPEADGPFRALEVGCGNGVNCFALAESFSAGEFLGVDYVPDMVHHANRSAESRGLTERCQFFEADAMDLDAALGSTTEFDVAFTVRCLINLQNDANQRSALASIASRVRVGGLVFLIENSQKSYGQQNELRQELGLEVREPASFNYFIDETSLFKDLHEIALQHVRTVDISSLHDVVLYVLLPAVNGGVVDYESPIVDAAARLEAGDAGQLTSRFGGFGQNRLFVLRRQT